MRQSRREYLKTLATASIPATLTGCTSGEPPDNKRAVQSPWQIDGTERVTSDIRVIEDDNNMAEIQLGSDVTLKEDSNGDPVIQDDTTGDTWSYDSSKNKWVGPAGEFTTLDVTDALDVTNGVTAGSVTTDAVTTDSLSGTAILHDDSQDLQTLVDDHNEVHITPGTYTNQSYPITPPIEHNNPRRW